MRIVVLVAVALCTGRVYAQLPPWQNWTLPVDQRVADLLSLLTLEEKLGQLYATSAAIPRLNISSYNVCGPVWVCMGVRASVPVCGLSGMVRLSLLYVHLGAMGWVVVGKALCSLVDASVMLVEQT